MPVESFTVYRCKILDNAFQFLFVIQATKTFTNLLFFFCCSWHIPRPLACLSSCCVKTLSPPSHDDRSENSSNPWQHFDPDDLHYCKKKFLLRDNVKNVLLLTTTTANLLAVDSSIDRWKANNQITLSIAQLDNVFHLPAYNFSLTVFSVKAD